MARTWIPATSFYIFQTNGHPLLFEVLCVLSFSHWNSASSWQLLTHNATTSRSVWSPWQQCNTFGASSGYLIKTGSLCVRWTWTLLLSLKLLSEADTPEPKKKRVWGTETRDGGMCLEREESVTVRSPWWCLCIDHCTVVSHSKSIHRWPLQLFFFFFWKKRASRKINRNIPLTDFQST